MDDALPPDYFSIAGVGVLIGDDEPIPDLIVGIGEIPMDGRGVPIEQVVLAVEVVSASTTVQDRVAKPYLYAEAGIGEYELTHRISAGHSATLHSPFEFTIDPATLLH
ncbi:Uma2 family endonuclease [Nocardia terpenica]|uniref:Uma2 family endonuclease n=1 Tax=Nocardia terpenica TaxID=455432 RepID=UPI002B4AC282|nr:Uma2 family endonuclease [Nocardia terpenica]